MRFLYSAFLLLFLAASFHTANAEPPRAKIRLSPQALSDRITDMTDTLTFVMGRWGGRVGLAKKASDFANLRYYRETCEEFVTRYLDEIRNIEDSKHSEKLRHLMSNYLEFEQKLIREKFIPVEKRTNALSEDEFMEFNNDLWSEDEIFSNEIDAAQKAFAEKNGVTLKKHKMLL